MRSLFLFALVLIVGVPAWSQVEPDATGAPDQTLDGTKMMLPPPVSSSRYPNVVGEETRTNFISGALTFQAAYNDNVYAGIFTSPLTDTILTVLPTVTYDRTTPQQKQSFSYSPGFTFYQPTSELNSINQEASAEYDYRFSPYTGISVQDSFLQTTNTYGSPAALLGGGVSGSAGGSIATILIPYAELVTNTLSGSFDKQFERNQMFGVSGNFSLVNYPNPSQSPDVFDSKTAGGSGFFSLRLNRSSYVGATYEYSRIFAHPANADSVVQVHGALPFVTVYFNRTMSMSVVAGPQYYKVAQTGLSDQSAWTPSIAASLGLQASRSNVAVSYVRSVTAGDGLLGAFIGNSADLSMRRQLNRSWIVGVIGEYGNIQVVTSSTSASQPAGHRIWGDAFVQRAFGDHFRAEARYHRLHQSYNNIPVLSNNPNSNAYSVTLTYQFLKPIGR